MSHSSTLAAPAAIDVNNDAVTRYIGQTEWMTSGSRSTTAEVTLTASVTDPTGPVPTGATLDVIDITLGLPGKVLASKVLRSANARTFLDLRQAACALQAAPLGGRAARVAETRCPLSDRSDAPNARDDEWAVACDPAAEAMAGGDATEPEDTNRHSAADAGRDRQGRSHERG